MVMAVGKALVMLAQVKALGSALVTVREWAGGKRWYILLDIDIVRQGY